MNELRIVREIMDDGTAKFIAGDRKLVCDPADVPPEIRYMLTGAGIVQKVGDAAALPKGATIAEKFAAMEDVWNNLLDGRWNAVREKLSPEEKAARLAESVRAAWIALKGEDAAAFERYLQKYAVMPDGTKLGRDVVIENLAKNAKIAAEMARQAAERRGGAKVEFTDL